MSRNMGNRVNTDSNTSPDFGWHESPGLPVRSVCLGCGKKKRSGESHPKCSRKLQRMRQQGVIL